MLSISFPASSSGTPRSTAPLMNFWRSRPMASSPHFLAIFLRSESAVPGVYPATSVKILITCSWYTRMPSVSEQISSTSGWNGLTLLASSLRFLNSVASPDRIVPGRFSAVSAVMSSKDVNGMSSQAACAPVESYWKMPTNSWLVNRSRTA